MMRWRSAVILVALLLAISPMAQGPRSVRAQLEAAVLDRVTRAAVQIVAIPVVGGVPDPDGVITGSGTIVASSGLILTNQHVVAEADRADVPVGIFLSDGRSEPRLAFFAEVVRADATLDLAVLQIIADRDGNVLSPDGLDLPYIPLGDSSQLRLGDDLYILGFPGIGMSGLTYTEGVVSGFRAQPGIAGDAWILTDGVISGGSSGGTATNAAGHLVGVPTGGNPLDCRPGDTNSDGAIDDTDVGCIPFGGTVGLLRPVNLAKPLLLAVDSNFVVDPPPQSAAAGDEPTEARPETVPAAGPPTATAPTAAVPAAPIVTPMPPPVTERPAPEPLVIASFVPEFLSLSPGQSFRQYEAGAPTLPALVSGFANPGMARQALASFGWQESVYRIFAADNPPPNATGWVELHIHRFATVDGAHEALPFLAWERQKITDLTPRGLGLFADQSIALMGPAYNGTELTIFARRGNLIVRATGIAPNGDPTNDVIESILIPLAPLAEDARVVSPVLIALLPGPEHVSTALTLTEERARSASNTAETFADWDEASRLFQAWGWRESASRVYTASGGPTANGTIRFEAVVYRWRDPAAASAALTYFVATRAEALSLSEVPAPTVGDEARAIAGVVGAGTEATIYVRFEAILLRFTAIGPGNPLADLHALLNVP